jgi:cysteine desulfurase
MDSIIYLDNHATTKCDLRVVEEMLPFFSENYGNAHSFEHAYGQEAANAVEKSREFIAGYFGAEKNNVLFTSGATESNNLAIKGILSPRTSDAHIITSAIEHNSVLGPVKRLKRAGCRVTILPVDHYGMVDPSDVEAAICSETKIVSIMYANNEVGTLQPVKEIGENCRKHNVVFHCDAVQAAGHYPIRMNDYYIDLLSISAHKIYGPKGIGALILTNQKRMTLEPLFHGGSQERHFRSGTLPVPLIVGFAKALSLCENGRDRETERLSLLRDNLWSRLTESLDGIVLNGHLEKRLPNNLNLSIEGIDGDVLLTNIKKIAVSSSAACSSGEPSPSYVLKAMGVDENLAKASLRIGLGRFNTEEEIQVASEELVSLINKLRN